MQGPELMVLYAALFIGVLLAFDGILQFFSRGNGGEEAINRRLRMLASGADPEEVLNLLRRRRPRTAWSGSRGCANGRRW